jgi:hypothetical protein
MRWKLVGESSLTATRAGRAGARAADCAEVFSPQPQDAFDDALRELFEREFDQLSPRPPSELLDELFEPEFEDEFDEEFELEFELELDELFEDEFDELFDEEFELEFEELFEDELEELLLASTI